MHNAPGAYIKYASGAYVKCKMLQERTFKKCSWNILNLQNYPRLFMFHTPGANVPEASAPGA